MNRFLLFALLLCGCSDKQPPKPAETEKQPAAELLAKSTASQSLDEHHVPIDPVQIVNRKTGLAIHLGPVRIEPSGDFYKLTKQDGQCLALENWALKGEKVNARHNPGVLRVVKDSGDQSTFWKIEALGPSSWRIINRAKGECLVPRDSAGHVVLAPSRDGAVEQQWRFEPIKPEGDSGSKTVAETQTLPEIASKPKSDEPENATRSQDGFRLWALTDLIWIQKAAQGKRTALTESLGEDSNRGQSCLFRVIRYGKGPIKGLFNVAGKPITPVWKSSDLTVLTTITDSQSGDNHFSIHRPGKTTVSVSVGTWSASAVLTVLEGPIALTPPGMSQHEFIKAYGYPPKKYAFSKKGTDRTGFEPIRKKCCWVGNSSFHAGTLQGELWEYEQWPRCLFYVMGDTVNVIVTRPGQNEDASKLAEKGSDSKQKTAEPEDEEKADVNWLTFGRDTPVSVGDVGCVDCAYTIVEKIIDERTCILRPWFTAYEAPLPILVKGWPTTGKVTGQRVDLGEKLFRVSGTTDLKKADGGTVRVFVLEATVKPSK